MKTSNSAIKEYANYKKRERNMRHVRLEQFWSLHVYLLSHNWNVYCNLGQDWDLPLPEIRWANGEKCWPLLSWIFFVGAICPKYSTFSKGLFFVKLAKKSQCERSKQIFKLEKLYQKKRKQSIHIFFTVFAPLGCCGRTPALLKEKVSRTPAWSSSPSCHHDNANCGSGRSAPTRSYRQRKMESHQKNRWRWLRRNLRRHRFSHQRAGGFEIGIGQATQTGT